MSIDGQLDIKYQIPRRIKRASTQRVVWHRVLEFKRRKKKSAWTAGWPWNEESERTGRKGCLSHSSRDGRPGRLVTYNTGTKQINTIMEARYLLSEKRVKIKERKLE